MATDLIGISISIDSVNLFTVKMGSSDVWQREQLLNQRSNINTASTRRARLFSIVLLCLMGHALFVSLTHHHDGVRNPSAHSKSSLIAASSDSQTDKETGSDAGCLSCRLQRNCNSNLHTATVSVEAIVESPVCETLLAESYAKPLEATLFGRAPPLA